MMSTSYWLSSITCFKHLPPPVPVLACTLCGKIPHTPQRQRPGEWQINDRIDGTRLHALVGRRLRAVMVSILYVIAARSKRPCMESLLWLRTQPNLSKLSQINAKLSIILSIVGQYDSPWPRTKVFLGAVVDYMIYASCLAKKTAREQLCMAANTPRWHREQLSPASAPEKKNAIFNVSYLWSTNHSDSDWGRFSYLQTLLITLV